MVFVGMSLMPPKVIWKEACLLVYFTRPTTRNVGLMLIMALRKIRMPPQPLIHGFNFQQP
jgi:hypothetical protein